MVSFTLVSLAVLVSSAVAQVSSTDVAWADRLTVCKEGAGPMNVTSGEWEEAQKLFGNSTKPAWIASYNVRPFPRRGRRYRTCFQRAAKSRTFI